MLNRELANGVEETEFAREPSVVPQPGAGGEFDKIVLRRSLRRASAAMRTASPAILGRFAVLCRTEWARTLTQTSVLGSEF